MIKEKRGFTLIELLAVVVILAAVALISTPIVFNIIDEAKKGALQNTAYGIIEASKLNYSRIVLKEGSIDSIVFTYVDGVESSEPSGLKLDYKGKKPRNGTIMVNSEGEIAVALHNGEYCADKGYKYAQVTVSKKPVAECQIGYPFIVQNGLVLSFDGKDFTNSPGTTSWVDKSISGNNSVPTNFAYTTTSGSDDAGAVAFDGTDDYASFTNPNIYSSSFTISMFVFFNEDNREILFGDYSLPNSISVNFEKNTSGRLRLYWGGAPDISTPSGVTPINQYCHLVVVASKESGTVKFYVDGIEVHSYSGVLSDKTPTGLAYIGRDNRTGITAMNGKIKNFQVYDRALSVDEILQNWAASK